MMMIIIIIIIIIAPHWSFEEGAKKKGLLNDLEPLKCQSASVSLCKITKGIEHHVIEVEYER